MNADYRHSDVKAGLSKIIVPVDHVIFKVLSYLIYSRLACKIRYGDSHERSVLDG
jgi:hypothetical protein